MRTPRLLQATTIVLELDPHARIKFPAGVVTDAQAIGLAIHELVVIFVRQVHRFERQLIVWSEPVGRRHIQVERPLIYVTGQKRECLVGHVTPGAKQDFTFRASHVQCQYFPPIALVAPPVAEARQPEMARF